MQTGTSTPSVAAGSPTAKPTYKSTSIPSTKPSYRPSIPSSGQPSRSTSFSTPFSISTSPPPTSTSKSYVVQATQTITGITTQDSTAQKFLLAVVQGVISTLAPLCATNSCFISSPVVNVVKTKRRTLLVTPAVSVVYTVSISPAINVALISSLLTSGTFIMTKELQNDGFPDAVALTPLVTTFELPIGSSSTPTLDNTSTLTSSSPAFIGGLNLAAFIGIIVGGFFGICLLGGMIYASNRRVRGNQAPQAPIQDVDVDINTSQYIPPSPVNLSINLSASVNATAAHSYNDQLLYPYEIFSLDIEDPAFPVDDAVPANDTDISPSASAPILSHDFNYPDAYSL